MLTQAGRRYEGPVAFNPDPNYLNNVGLIEAYTTVLERGKSLSIEGTPPVNYEPANTSLLLIGGRIADFYMMLGNEAYADSTDPTIGFATDGTGGTDYGVFASSVFAFQNQLDSLLEEELVLLRGRDDSAASVRIGPVYNRLFWNFTRGDGELAYAQSYNIIDVNFDGFVNINDASTMFPQGHGDAWGHYLTATKTYYDLLRNTNYTWVPRAESVRLGAAVVSVDYLDERKFARAAAAKAKVGCGDGEPHLPPDLRGRSIRSVPGLQGHRYRTRLGPLRMGATHAAGGLRGLADGEHDSPGTGSRPDAFGHHED
jgi:hypothetical protein